MTATRVRRRRSEPEGTVTSSGGRVGKTLINASAIAALIYLFLPIFVIVAFSFNAPKGKFNAVWQHFTFDNWLHPFAEGALVDALWRSLKIALPPCPAEGTGSRRDSRRLDSPRTPPPLG